jgi:flagellar biosynthetic protein FliR
MFAIIDQLALKIPVFLLAFFRIAAIIMVMPIFGYSTVAGRIRLVMAFSLTIFVLPLISQVNLIPASTLELILLVSREVLIGLIIGFGARLIFEGLNMAGNFVGYQMGLSIATVIDPTSQEEAPIIGQFWFLLSMIYFFAIGGHHFFIQVLTGQFRLIPLTEGQFNPALGRQLIQGGSQIFITAVKLAAPVLVLLLVVDTALALVARVMPQINIFIVALPLKIGVGIFAIISSLSIFQLLFGVFYNNLSDYLKTTINLLRGI